MHEGSHEVNFCGVTLAAVGTAIGDYFLQGLGLIVTLLVAYWNSRAKQTVDQRAQAELKHERDRADFYLRKAARAEAELVTLRALPAAITPPFPPGEACSDV